MQQTEIVPLLGSRICHDLISPIGAIGNGLELLLFSGAHDTPEMALIRDSVAAANARIRFFRIAFGKAPDGQQISNQDIAAIIKDYTATSRIEIEWRDTSNPSRPVARLLFLLIMCMEHAFPSEGQITISQHEGTWHVVGRGPKMRLENRLWSLLSVNANQNNVEPSEIQFPLARSAADAGDTSLKTNFEEDRIEIRF